MEPNKSRNGFYTVTFINKKNLNEDYILTQFKTIGKVCHLVKNNNRVFIRFKYKDEAERALEKFGKTLNLEMAKNKVNSRNQLNDSQVEKSEEDCSVKEKPLLPAPPKSRTKMNLSDTEFHLILGNLPKNYTVDDVKALVEEVDPLFINNLEETKAFHLKFCHIVLRSAENLNYLINKLNGFVISGQELVAVEAKNLLEWRQLKK